MNKKNFYIMCILFVYFKPDWINNTVMAAHISLIFLLVKTFVSLYYIPKSILLYKINKIDFLIFFFLLSQILAAFITQSSYLNYIGGQFFLLGLYAFLKCCLISNAKGTIESILLLSFAFILIQILTQLVFPHGLNELYSDGDFREYFLGRKNATTPYIILSMGSFYLLHKKMNQFLSLYEIGMIFLFGIMTVLTRSSTAIVCYLLFILLRLIGLKENLGRFYTKISFTIYLFMTGIIIFSQSTFLSIFTSILGRDITFSGRASIWQLAIRIFEDNFWFGGGLNINYNAWTNGIIVNSAHNTLLDILSRTGIFAGLFFALILFHCIIGKYRIKSKTLLTIFLSFLMYTLMENSSVNIFILLVTVVIYLPLSQELLDEKIF